MSEKKILVVENDGIIALHIRRCLKNLNYQVIGLAVTGEEAIQLAQESQPDLVLMDIHLDGPMDGITAAEHIRNRFNIPVVYVTAYSDEQTLTRAKITEPYGYILKPFHERDLLVAVEMAFHKHHLEQELHESERRFRDTLENVHLIAVMLDVEGRIIYCNEYLLELTGWQRDEILGLDWFEVFVPREYHLADHYKDIIQQGWVNPYYENDILTRQGERRSIAWSNTLLYDTKGHIIGTSSLGQDLTERKLAEESSRRRTAELEALVQVSSAMRIAQTIQEILPIALDQLVGLFDAQAATIILQERQGGEYVMEITNGDWQDMLDHRAPIEQEITSQVIQSGQPYWENNLSAGSRLESLIRKNVANVACVPLIAHKDTLGVIWLGSCQPISAEQLRLLNMIGDVVANAIYRQALHQDLRDQFETLMTTKDRLVQNEKLAAVGRLVAGVAHELNNPLTTIMLYTQLLQERLTSETEQRDLDRIMIGARHAAKIVRSLLDFARRQPPQRKPIDINEVLQNSLEFLSYELSSRGINCHTNLAPDLPLTMADPQQIQQVFVNLISNAWQAIERSKVHGEISWETAFGPSRLANDSSDSESVISVILHDNGPGIDAETIHHIFDPFYTTRSDGTGLGLSICHGFITDHGGQIWVESQPGQGATFYIELPVDTPDPTRWIGAQPLSTRVVAKQTERILVIEDDASVQEVIVRALLKQGYKVDNAADGAAGLELLEETTYDLILCDLRMPEVGGIEFYRRLAAQDANLARRIVFMSGDTIGGESQRFLRDTGTPLLNKPFEIADLISKVENLLKELKPGYI